MIQSPRCNDVATFTVDTQFLTLKIHKILLSLKRSSRNFLNIFCSVKEVHRDNLINLNEKRWNKPEVEEYLQSGIRDNFGYLEKFC